MNAPVVYWNCLVCDTRRNGIHHALFSLVQPGQGKSPKCDAFTRSALHMNREIDDVVRIAK